MTIADLLDGSFAILKRRPREVLLLAAAFVIPVQLLASVLLRDVLAEGGFAGTGLGESTSSVGFEESGELTGLGPTLVSALISVSSLALLAGALARLVADWHRGERGTPGAVILATLRRSPALLVGVVVVHLLELLGLVAFGIGAYVMMCFLHVVSPVIVAEEVGPFTAIVRSFRLTTSKAWRSLYVPLLVGVVGALVGLGFQLIPELVILLVSEDWYWLVRSSGSMLAQLVVAPFTAGVAVLYHLDLRIRSEGYDIHRQVAWYQSSGVH
ncbi:MAG: hypothetical protein U5K30_08720 [Acidimicrobiales bacterium]|nr:hypothetical protein [Acidimicrobiales bacterium]